jgi:uncharacterized membrane protein YkvI
MGDKNHFIGYIVVGVLLLIVLSCIVASIVETQACSDYNEDLNKTAITFSSLGIIASIILILVGIVMLAKPQSPWS